MRGRAFCGYWATIMSDASTRSPQQCPLCGIAMLANKSHPTKAEFDTWNCLRCDTEIAMKLPRPPSGRTD